MGIEVAVSVVSAAAAVASAVIAAAAVSRSRAAQQVGERMFRRQGVIDLHLAWQGVNRIDPDQPITGDVVKAVSVLELTAAIWNHDIVERSIIYQSYWESFRELVETLAGSHSPVPQMDRRCRDFITLPVQRAYDEMRQWAGDQVSPSRIS